MKQGREWIYYGAGMVYMKNQRYKEAKHEFNKTINSNPSDGNAYVQLGRIKRIHGKRDEAKSLFNKAVFIDPKNVAANCQLGVSFLEEKNFEKAKDCFFKVLEFSPLHTDAMIHLAIVLGRQGDFEYALSMIEQAYALSDTAKDGFARMGWIKAETEDWAGALELADRDRAANRLSPAWQINLAQLYGRMGDFEYAVALVKKAYAKNETLKDGFGRLGWIKVGTAEWQDVSSMMTNDLKAGRMSSAGKCNMAIVRALLGHWDEAFSLVLDAYAKDDGLNDAFGWLGWAGYLHGKGDHFLCEQIKKDKYLNRFSLKGKRFQVFHHTVTGCLEKAVRETEVVYRKHSEQMNWFSQIGWLYVRHGNARVGCKLMERDLELGRIEQSWKIAYTVALSICGMGGKAQTLLEKALDGRQDREIINIGFDLRPDRVMTATQLKEFVFKGFCYYDNFFKTAN